jgi:LDH2 family malate/lactate/ureidoglycolate dehydrogenase
MRDEEMFSTTPLALEGFVCAVMRAVGLDDADAQTIAWALVTANLEGVDTHGVSRLALYARRVHAGLANARPVWQWTYPAPAVALLDADNALGPVAADAAMERAIELAQSQGIGMVAVAHTNHAAALSAYTERAAAANCLGLMVGNTPPALPPWGGREAFFGTNPLAFAAPGPTPGGPPVVIDMAMSVVARGKIIAAARQGRTIPDGWALDADGKPTTNAQAALAGSLLPMAGAKGYALALMIEILSAIVPGASWGPNVRSPYTDMDAPTDAGLCCLAIDLGRLMSSDTYTTRLGAMLGALRATPTLPGQQIRVPGEQRANTRAVRNVEGIPIDVVTRTELDALGVELAVKPIIWASY